MSLQGGSQDGARGRVWTTASVLGARQRVIVAAATPASAVWPANNDAYAVPFLVSSPVTFVQMFFISGTSPGTTNFDLGIYNDSFTLLRSLGATASVNTTDTVLPAGGGTFTTPLTLARGRYFMAMSSAATTLTTRAAVQGNQVVRALGLYKMATAHPLPATFVPASMGTTAFIPTFGMTTATGVII